jgi:addiction module RelB/DinJ family antitoxin
MGFSVFLDVVRTLCYTGTEVIDMATNGANLDANINIRTSSDLKASANEILKAMGLDISTAVNMFLIQVVDKRAMPFTLETAPPKKLAKLGGWEGKIWISDDFNEPMDEYGRFQSDANYLNPAVEGWEGASKE